MLIAGKTVTKGEMNIGGLVCFSYIGERGSHCVSLRADFIAVNAYVVGMFQPLGFLGSIYGWVIQALVDIKNLSQLLTEPVEVTDIENASPLPFMEHRIPTAGNKATACKRCKHVWSLSQIGTGVWRFCPYCGADNFEEETRNSIQLINDSDVLRTGISVEFRSAVI